MENFTVKLSGNWELAKTFWERTFPRSPIIFTTGGRGCRTALFKSVFWLFRYASHYLWQLFW